MRWSDGLRSPPGEFGSSQAITVSDVPEPDADWWSELLPFALTFDGYGAFGGFLSLADVASATEESWRRSRELPDDLVVLRSCLFFEQRRQRHLDQAPGSFPPTGEWMLYVRALVEAIRAAVSRAEAEQT